MASIWKLSITPKQRQTLPKTLSRFCASVVKSVPSKSKIKIAKSSLERFVGEVVGGVVRLLRVGKS